MIKSFNTQEEIKEEIIKCQNNPYYFATTYIKTKNENGEESFFTTPLTEKEFNKFFKKSKDGTKIYFNSKRRIG